jgi:rod shape-determining protein MreD
MKPKIFTCVVLILLAILQSTVLDYLKIFNVQPDILLIAVIIIALSRDLKSVMVCSYFAGFVKDLLGGMPLGINTLILPLLSFLVFRLSKEIVIESNYMRASVIAIAVILENLCALLAVSILKWDFPLAVFFKSAIIGSAYTASLFLILSQMPPNLKDKIPFLKL